MTITPKEKLALTGFLALFALLLWLSWGDGRAIEEQRKKDWQDGNPYARRFE